MSTGWPSRAIARATVRCRVPVLFAFGEFACAGGARSVGDLPAHVEAFVAERIPADRAAQLSPVTARQCIKNVRGPIEQMLRLVVPGFTGSRRALLEVPFTDELPGFFEYLVCERGLRRTTLHGYECYLRSFERYLRRVGVQQLVELSPALISAFVAERSGLAWRGERRAAVRGAARVSALRASRRRARASDLSKTVDGRGSTGSPTSRDRSRGRRSTGCSPVSIGADRGKRDYAALLLLVTYGLRSREVAALTLDDIDWKRERLSVPERKAGHSTAFPLSARSATRSSTTCSTVVPDTAAPCVLPGVRAGPSRSATPRCPSSPVIPAEGGCRRSPSGLAHAAPLVRAASRRCGLRAEDDRRLRRTSLGEFDRDLRQGRSRGAP